jgi:Right handed beta helix region
MILMIRAAVRLCMVVAAISAFMPTAPSYAADFVAFVSNVGSGTSCTAAQPCGDLTTAMELAENGAGQTTTARVICLSPITSDENSSGGSPGPNTTLEVDCPLGFMPSISFLNPNTVARFRGMTFTRSLFSAAIFAGANGTLILEDCAFVDQSSEALDIEPSGSWNLVIRNSRISNNGSGVTLKPRAGGSINATLDHVTIADNIGGGIKIDTTNGPVTLDVTDSVVSNNGGNGINAVGNAGGQAMVSIKNSVIAKNAVAGVQANGANAGLLVQTTLFDQNATGATSVVGGGHISTYGNNSIVGSSGSGFTGPAPLQ